MRYNSSYSCLRAQTASEVLFSDVAVSSQTSDQNYWTSLNEQLVIRRQG